MRLRPDHLKSQRFTYHPASDDHFLPAAGVHLGGLLLRRLLLRIGSPRPEDDMGRNVITGLRLLRVESMGVRVGILLPILVEGRRGYLVQLAFFDDRLVDRPNALLA